MSSILDKDLHRYFDGELQPDKAQKIQAQLAHNPEAQQRLANLQNIHLLLQDAHDSVVEQAHFEKLWEGIQNGIAAQPSLPLIEQIKLFLIRYRLAFASAAAVAILTLFLLQPFGDSSIHNDCVIESLDVDPNAVTTIFTVDNSEKDIRDNGEKDGNTTIIWVNEGMFEGDTGERD